MKKFPVLHTYKEVLGEESPREFIVTGVTPRKMIEETPSLSYKELFGPYIITDYERYIFPHRLKYTGTNKNAYSLELSPYMGLTEFIRSETIPALSIVKGPDGIIDINNGIKDLTDKTISITEKEVAEDPRSIYKIGVLKSHVPDIFISDSLLTIIKKHNNKLSRVPNKLFWYELITSMLFHTEEFVEMLYVGGVTSAHLPEIDEYMVIPTGPIGRNSHIDLKSFTLSLLKDLYGASPITKLGALLYSIGKTSTAPDVWPNHFNYEQISSKLIKRIAKRLTIKDHIYNSVGVLASLVEQIEKFPSMEPKESVGFLRLLRLFYPGEEEFIKFVRHERGSYVDMVFLSSFLHATSPSYDEGTLAEKKNKFRLYKEEFLNTISFS